MASRPKRRVNRPNYALLNDLGTTETGVVDLNSNVSNIMANKDDLLDIEANDEGEFDLDDQNWDARRLAVSDEKFSAQQQAYQVQMNLLGERELVIKRERELLDMKEQMVARQQELQAMEREIATRHAALARHENPGFEASAEKVVNWLDNARAPGTLGATASAGAPRKSRLTDPYTQAMALTNEDNLMPARTPGSLDCDLQDCRVNSGGPHGQNQHLASGPGQLPVMYHTRR